MAKSYLDKDGLLYFLQKIRPSSTPLMDGTASTGTSKRFAAEDHVHPRDTALAPKASPALTGTPTAPTAATGTATTQIATTEFVANTVGAMTSGVADVQIDNASIVTSGIAKIPTASASAKGLMTSTHYSKLEGIASGAEVNQNAFSTVKVAGTSLAADSKTDTLTITAGSNITLTPTASSDSFSIAATDTTYESKTAASGGTAVSLVTTGEKYTWNQKASTSVATSSANGLMPSTDKAKLDSLTITNGIIDASNLPSFVDDVIEAYAYETEQSTPYDEGWLYDANNTHISPEAGKIYVIIGARDTTVHPGAGSYYLDQYRWGGTSYIKLNDGGVSAITNAEIDTIVAS